MATNVVSNINPADISGSGFDIPAGTARHDVLLNILSEVVTLNSTSFGRITSASPTPAGIQYLADTGLTAGGTSYQNSAGGLNYYGGLYFKDDEELVANAGDTAACILFIPYRYSLGAVTIDPVKHASPAPNNPVNGALAYNLNNPVDTDTTYYKQEYEHNDNTASEPGQSPFQFQDRDDYYAGMNGDATVLPFKVYFFTADEFLAWRVVNTNYNRLAGVFMAWRWDTPGDGHFGRTDLPYVASRLFDPLSMRDDEERPFYSNYNGRFGQAVAIPEAASVGGTTLLDTGPGFGRYVQNAAPDNTDIVQDETVVYDLSFTAFPGTVPGLKVMRPDSVSLYDTMTVNATDYVCFLKDNYKAYFIQYQ